jgi:hypothetical protein
MMAAPAITKQKARRRAAIWGGPEPIGSWNTTIPPKIALRHRATLLEQKRQVGAQGGNDSEDHSEDHEQHRRIWSGKRAR